MVSVLRNVSWTELDRAVQVQQTNRVKHSPVISAFRWWARRPHAVVGALLDAAATEFGEAGYLVADPFSGGGTVAFEAARRVEALRGYAAREGYEVLEEEWTSDKAGRAVSGPAWTA